MNGKYDLRSRIAVRRFQRKQKLPVDGVVGAHLGRTTEGRPLMYTHGWVPPEGMYGFTKEEFDGVLVSVATLEASIPVELPGGGRPNANYRYAFAEKMHGWDVWAFQVALNSHQKATQIKEDGFFGPITANAVKQEQGRHHLTKDGVAGAMTQNAIATAEAKTAEVTHSIPVGLLKGVAEGESGLQFAAVSGPNWNDSYDAGITQDNLLIGELGDIDRWRNAFDLRVSFTTWRQLRKQYDALPRLARRGHGARRLVLRDPLPQLARRAEKTANRQFDTWRYFAVARTARAATTASTSPPTGSSRPAAVARVLPASGATAYVSPRSCTKSWGRRWHLLIVNRREHRLDGGSARTGSDGVAPDRRHRGPRHARGRLLSSIAPEPPPDADWARELRRPATCPPGDVNNPIPGAFLQLTEDPTGTASTARRTWRRSRT